MLLKPLFSFDLPLPVRFLQEDLTTTLSAQLGMVPILLIAFGQYNSLSLLVNALLLWMVALFMTLGGIVAWRSFFLQSVTALLLYLCLPLLFLFQTVVVFFAQYPLSVRGTQFSPTLVTLYYTLLNILIYFLRRKGRRA